MPESQEYPVFKHTAFVGLGSNVGERIEHLRYAVRRLRDHASVRIAAVSDVYETAAHTLGDDENARAYLNAVVEVETSLDPHELLTVCLDLERKRGRDRTHELRWAPRTLDLDLLIFDERRLDEPGLILPHPRMADRRFVLRPLADLAPDLQIPHRGDASVCELLASCKDTGEVRPTRFTIAIDEETGRSA